MRVEHQLLGLAEIGAHERHPAVRQLHVRRLDGQRQALERDRLVAPVELIRLAGREAQRHKRLYRNPCPLVPPRFREPVHAVVRAVIAAAAQLFEQPLGRSTLPPGQFGFFLQNLDQNLNPLAQLWRRLNTALIPKLSGLAADTLRTVARDTDSVLTISLIGKCRSKNARRIWPILSTPIIPISPSRPPQAAEGDIIETSEGSRLDAKNPPQGVIIASEFTPPASNGC
jgi:hypothetical protein